MIQTLAIEKLQELLPDFAKDTRVNIGNLSALENTPGLSEKQLAFVSLASGYAVKSKTLQGTLEHAYSEVLSEAERDAAKAAASIMSMNNVYYRAKHLIEDPELEALPARLRMTIMAKPGVEKFDFELASLAVSAINGCGKCLQSHHHELKKQGQAAGMTANQALEAIHSALRISSVIFATSESLRMAGID